LEHDGLDGPGWYGWAVWLGMMMHDLQQVVFGIFEDYEDTFVLQYDLNCVNDVCVRELAAKRHFTDCGLGNACVLWIALLVWFEPGNRCIRISLDGGVWERKRTF